MPEGPSYAARAENLLARALQRADPQMAVGGPFADDLVRLYTLLLLTRGSGTTSRDVHDAWAVATVRYNPAHKSLVPFDQLSPEVQGYDDLYRDAIREVAEKLEAST